MPPYHRLWASLLLLAGCASSPPPEPATPPTLPASIEAAAADPPPAPVMPKRAIPEGQLRREDVLSVLSDGIPTFLQKVEVEPALDREGHFQGWRVLAIRDPELAAGEVRPGDVIRKVNNQIIENPFQFFDVFQSLAFASELQLSVERGADRRDLRFPINDDPSAPPMPRSVVSPPAAAPVAQAPAEAPADAKPEPKKKAKKGKGKKP